MSDFQDTISEREDSIIEKMSEISNEDKKILMSNYQITEE